MSVGWRFWAVAGAVRFMRRSHAEVIGRVSHEGNAPQDVVKLAVATRPGGDFGAKGSVKLGVGQQAGEIVLSFKGTREEAADRAIVSVEGDYSVFFGNEQRGVEFTGSFQGGADLAPDEERILSEMEVSGTQAPGGRRAPPTRIQIVLRAKR